MKKLLLIVLLIVGVFAHQEMGELEKKVKEKTDLIILKYNKIIKINYLLKYFIFLFKCRFFKSILIFKFVILFLLL